jgi:hypothetical protein
MRRVEVVSVGKDLEGEGREHTSQPIGHPRVEVGVAPTTEGEPDGTSETTEGFEVQVGGEERSEEGVDARRPPGHPRRRRTLRGPRKIDTGRQLESLEASHHVGAVDIEEGAETLECGALFRRYALPAREGGFHECEAQEPPRIPSGEGKARRPTARVADQVELVDARAVGRARDAGDLVRKRVVIGWRIAGVHLEIFRVSLDLGSQLVQKGTVGGSDRKDGARQEDDRPTQDLAS